MLLGKHTTFPLSIHFPTWNLPNYQHLYIYTLPFLLLKMDKLSLFLLKSIFSTCMLDPILSNFKLFAPKISPFSLHHFFSLLGPAAYEHAAITPVLKKNKNKKPSLNLMYPSRCHFYFSAPLWRKVPQKLPYLTHLTHSFPLSSESLFVFSCHLISSIVPDSVFFARSSFSS